MKRFIIAMFVFAACSKSPATDDKTTQPPTTGTVQTGNTAFSAQQVQDVQTNWLYYGLINDENYFYFIYMGVQLLQADSILTIGVTPNIPNAVLCGAKVRLDSNATDKKMIITYNGNACPINVNDTENIGPMHFTATGTVVVSSPRTQDWDDTSTVKTDIQHLVIDVPGNRLIVDGVIETKSLTGGNPILLHAGSSPIVQTVKSNEMVATLRDGSVDKWQLDMKRVYSYDKGIVITTTGEHANDTVSNIAQWGVDRGNHPFITQITRPVVNEQSCGMHVTSGEVNQSTGRGRGRIEERRRRSTWMNNSVSTII